MPLDGKGKTGQTHRAQRNGPVELPEYTVANAPLASEHTGSVIYCSNGAAGSAILAFSDGTNWKRSDTGATIAAA